MPDHLKTATDALHRKFCANWDNGLQGLPESCATVNDASRAVILAMLEERRDRTLGMAASHAQVWLGNLNDRDKPTLRPYRGPVALHGQTAWERAHRSAHAWMVTHVGIVYNFGASFVVPSYDEELQELLSRWRRGAHKKSAAADLTAIEKRVESLGGVWLYWS